MKLGISGNLTKTFIASPLTPLLLLSALMLGGIALMELPREEEPQISVPMVDIQVRADGLKAQDAARLVTEPLETIVKAINGVEHVYSQTQDDQVLVTARFLVGTKSDEAILRVHEKVRANMDRIPIGIPEPLIVGRGIDDVAIVSLTLAPKPEAAERWTDNSLYHLAENLRIELVKIDNVGLTYIVGGRPDQIRVEPDPEKLSLYGVTLAQLVDKVRSANRSFLAGQIRDQGRAVPVVAGQTLQGVPDIGLLLLTTRDGRPVYVRDVAKIVVGGKPLEQQSWQFIKDKTGELTRVPAVSIAIAKRAGANAVDIAANLVERLQQLRGSALPDDIEVQVTRNYGATASEKADELLFHLGLATLSIVALIVFAIGWREGIVVAIVIPTTILLTLFASWIMGYTINRVSLFALIFSIGILVDDAIVVIENIAALGDAYPAKPRSGHHRGCGRGWQSDPPGDADGGGCAVAHAVRVGPYGSVHEPHPGECVGGDDLLLFRGRDGDAMADDENREKGRRLPSARARRRHPGAHLRRGGEADPAKPQALACFPSGRGRGNARVTNAALDQVGDGETPPVRQ
jgi:multidrug efflux pump subunit AcrB